MGDLVRNTNFSAGKGMTNYARIADSAAFKELVLQKKRFIVGYSWLYIGYPMLLPFLAFYTDILNVKVYGDFSLAWAYGISIIVMCWIVCTAYVKKSALFDEKIKELLDKEGTL
ncbi:MAG: DUF485 domain-containing protein [Bacillus sp. (in: firmicutes)]